MVDLFPEYEAAKNMGHPEHVLYRIGEMKECYGIDYTIKFFKYGNLQDLDCLLVREFFKDHPTGRFLGIGSGAGDDQTGSLLEKGWAGVYCDPDPLVYNDLFYNIERYRDQVTLVNAAITPTGGLCDFYISQTSAFSSVKKENVSELRESLITSSITMEQLLTRVGEDFDYVQFDIEGIDGEVIRSIDWSKHLRTCKLIGVEMDLSVWQQLWEQGRFVISHVTEYNVYFQKIPQ